MSNFGMHDNTLQQFLLVIVWSLDLLVQILIITVKTFRAAFVLCLLYSVSKAETFNSCHY